MKIAFFETAAWEKLLLKKLLKNHSLTFFKEKLNSQTASKAKNFDAISIFVYSKVDKAVLNNLPKLKILVTRSTGFDHVDFNECKKRGICFCNIPSYGSNTVAEHTFALILALSRKIHQSHLRRIQNNYSLEGLKGFDLKGKTVGILGLGKIGKHVARIANGFEMNILACDNHPENSTAEQLNLKFVSLKELLKKSDILTIHVPYTKSNYHLINKKTVILMKKGSILINTSRGEIVDTEAMAFGLDNKILSGVGLDVLEGEELIKEEKRLVYDGKKEKQMKQLAEDHILLARDNVVFTPHIAFYSQEALERIIEKTAECINCFSKSGIDKSCIVC